MNLVTINVNSTSNKTASATGMVIRENSQYRIVFFPKLVDNEKIPEECVNGTLLCQKKRKSDSWEDMNNLSLRDIKVGEWTKFNIELGEMLNLIRYADKLKELYDSDKTLPRVKQKHLLILDTSLDQKEIDSFNQFAKENPDSISNLRKILDTDLDLSALLNRLKENPDLIQNVADKLDSENQQKLYNELRIKFINPKYLRENLNNDKEEYWQELFTKNPDILYSIIPSVMQFICKKPYLGGKAIDNSGGTLSDLLYKCGNNVSIIEIKTPETELMKANYRNNVYSPSEELSSAIIQLRNQKDLLLKNYYNLKESSDEKGIKFEAYDPKLYLIIGNTENLKGNQVRSFELYRNSFKDIEIITFDEVIEKLELIVNNLSR